MNVIQILKDKGREVATESPSQAIAVIATILSERRIGALVLVDDGRIAGIVSERDIIRAIAQFGGACLDKPVREIMTGDVVTCRESDALDHLMGIMTAGRFRHLPVVEEGNLVGIISIGDVVKNHIAEVEMEASALKSYVAGA